jgi:hypothetical protein
MAQDPDDIERSLMIPENIAVPAMRLVQQQDAVRGDWDSPREGEMYQPPWPEIDNAGLRYLLHKFHACVDAGMDIRVAAASLAAHA